ncbi:hypothetical protein ACFX5K_02540 [Rickettsiales bacterium LUAb2]
MIKIFLRTLVVFLLAMLISCANNDDYKINQTSPYLQALIPFSVKEVNGFLINDEFGNPSYLVVIYAKVKNYSWKQDNLQVNTKKGLTSEQIDKVVSNHPEYLYITENIEFKFLVKKLNTDQAKEQTVTIPYFVIANLKSENAINSSRSQVRVPFANVMAIRIGQNTPQVNTSKDPNKFVPNYLINNANNDGQYNLYNIADNNIKINLNNKKVQTITKNYKLKLQMKVNDYPNLELLIGFKLNQSQYNALQNYAASLR